MNNSDGVNLSVTVVSAAGLYKSDLFTSPDPFAMVTFNGEQTCSTTVLEKTVSPRWNDRFMLKANNYGVLAIRIFDHKKFNKKEQGFLGVLKFQVGSVIDLNKSEDKTITRDLQISKGGSLVSHGKLTVVLSTNFYFHTNRPDQNSLKTPVFFSKRHIEPAPMIQPMVVSHYTPTVLQNSVPQAPPVSNNISDVNVMAPVDEKPLSNRIHTSEGAALAWKRNFPKPQVHLERNEPSPFTTSRQLGGGGIGIVFETKLEGISLALKRTFSRRLTPYHLNEFEIMSRMTERRHKHIVELIGSYVHKQQGGFELGLLIWPVARCDLALFLQDIDALGQWVKRHSGEAGVAGAEELDPTIIEMLSAMTGVDQKWNSEQVNARNAAHLHESSLGLLHSRFGCIANAVAWLHQHGIRHKDLKPSQILLSPDGLWLTDFGWSKDMSELAHSATSGGDNITFKYQSPERARKEACGRPEDIFAMGCIFLEMAYQLVKPMLPKNSSAPWQEQGWYFQANLDEVQEFLMPLKRSTFESGHGFILIKLIANMLAVSPDERPAIEKVVDRLSAGSYFGEC